MIAARQDDLFEHALTLPRQDRAAWLATACGTDIALRQCLESLLEAHDGVRGFMDSAMGEIGPAKPGFECVVDEKPQDRIGRYKLLQKLGEGGCGVVYMAEQEESVRRRVALKIIKLGMDTKAVIARFDAERQALARMDHPNIARVLDAGATDSGRPYFVMELVKGLRITEYCDQNCLTTEQRLDLFIKVCQAIQHAHQKGIIHRDIKPSNILVTLNDGEPVAKVIDFGIAKATQGRLTEQTLFTAFEQFIGTPAYVSPEQAEMTGLDVDTRSDIYSLGVLLYELLAGRTPFDTKQLMEAGLDEMRRLIREQEPPRASQRFRGLNDSDRTAVARHHATDGPNHANTLSGDLDWIVMRCLEKDPARRYETANDLAADIQRYRENEPVHARPPSTTYLLQKLIRRHRLAFGAGAAMAATLAIGFAASTTLYLAERQAVERARRAEENSLRDKIKAEAARLNEARQRELAEAARKRSEEESARRARLAQLISDAMRNMGLLASIGDPHTFRHVLQQTAKLKKELADHPEIEAGLDETLGGAYFKMGDYKRAEELFADALELRRAAQGENSAPYAQSLDYLGLVYAGQGKWEQAEACFRESLQVQQTASVADNPALARTMSTYGWILAQQAKFSEAEHYLRLALARQRKSNGLVHVDVAATFTRLGSVLTQEGRIKDAEAALTEALSITRQLFGPISAEVASALNLLAVTVALDQRRLSEAIGLYREALDIRDRIKNPNTTTLRRNLPSPVATVSEIREALVDGHVARRTQQPSPLETMLAQRASMEEIETVLRDAHRYAQSQYPKDSWEDAFYLALTAWVLLEEKKYGEAETLTRQCLAIRQRLRPDDWSVYHAQHMLGAATAGQKRVAEAESLLVEGYRGMKARVASMPDFHIPRLGESAKRLIQFYADTGRMEEAAKWQAEFNALPDEAKRSFISPMALEQQRTPPRITSQGR